MSKISSDFYLSSDVVQVGYELLGKRICSAIDGKYCSAIITETEAYAGIEDKASHAYGGKRTKRTEIMYAKGGVAYVYLCYGIHFLFNVVTNLSGIPHAVLVRGVRAESGKETMLNRRGITSLRSDSLNGPGKVSRALGITKAHNAVDLNGDQIWLETTDIQIDAKNSMASKRIGIDYAEEDALLPYRFSIIE